MNFKKWFHESICGLHKWKTVSFDTRVDHISVTGNLRKAVRTTHTETMECIKCGKTRKDFAGEGFKKEWVS